MMPRRERRLVSQDRAEDEREHDPARQEEVAGATDADEDEQEAERKQGRGPEVEQGAADLAVLEARLAGAVEGLERMHGVVLHDRQRVARPLNLLLVPHRVGMEERDRAEAAIYHLGLGPGGRPHRRQEDDDPEQKREQPKPLATQEAAVVEEALEEDEAGDRRGETSGVVDLEAEPHRQAAEQVVERPAAVERPQQEVKDKQGGELGLHVVRPLAAVVDVPLGDGQQEGGQKGRPAPEQAPHDQVQQQHREHALDDRSRPQPGQIVPEQPHRPGGDGIAERRKSVPPELEDAPPVEDTAALEADRGLVPVDEGRDAAQVWQPQRERYPQDPQYEQQLGYLLPPRARQADRIPRADRRSGDD